ncbi:hypothetical protein FJMB80055_31880 [Enterobacter hormaechei]|nr:hypothetical protein FJMB80001_09280 [Enterobacter hormaechei]BDI82220.1 hypothetical protein FJMB80002_09280 [Enterobacter hormaechei]BDJ01549.1 hypothetical protein FJMB80007_09260 [Enterobacter hormaechei]BDJ06495.1 hypothetical protein FJMB80008_09600 [Enterobacter hormaechei]BDJ16220.1 hypothetical protein FJMB80012_09210 [Enterobacter hormaechei]
MIPHDVERDRRHASRFGAEPGFGFRHFRQVIGQHVDAAVHKNPVDNLGGIIFRGVAAYEIGQQIAGEGAVREVSEMQVSEKIHAFYSSGGG